MTLKENEGQPKRQEEPRYLMNGTPFGSYGELIDFIGKLKPRKGSLEQQENADLRKSQPGVFPAELVEAIASYFTVRKLDPNQTVAIGCSSSSNQYPLKECLHETDSTWWISAIGSFRKGQGEEYVEFRLDATNIVRLSTIYISIPTLPTGPLSVRTMRLDGKQTDLDTKINNSSDDKRKKGSSESATAWHPVGWQPVTPILTVENRSGFQRIDLEKPIDAQYIRLVCLTNQASTIDSRFYLETAAAVGFFTVKFA